MRICIEIPATPQHIDEVYQALASLWERAGSLLVQVVDPQTRICFETALVEVITNQIRHAYPETDVVGTVQIELILEDDHVEANLIDHGAAFESNQFLQTQPAINVENVAEGGYGLRLATALLDKIEYARIDNGNLWKLLKIF